ncbi:MAG: glycosyltransferase family 39 protein [Holophaga sp.]|nr:glycosyltransferase family 39 protein [Holophaga sp.]
MDELQPPDCAGAPPRHPLVRWIRANRAPLLFALLILLIVPMRDLWAPDEPDFAQCVREMRARGSWLLPYLNGQPYSEKPILFYWLMKGSAIGLDRLTGGAGFVNGISAWALRLPSALSAIAFMFGFRAWTARFLRRDLADPAAMILATVSIWIWQAQAIQIDMLFAALLAASWMAWLSGYLVLRGHTPGRPTGWFLGAYAALALAFLAKGPLALALTLPLWLAFLAWQRDFGALRRVRAGSGLLLGALIILPWYAVAGLRGGPGYAYEMVVHQNFERALHAWDHIQPPWKYVEYLASDFFPWTLLLPALALFLKRGDARRTPAGRFLILAVAVPFLLLSCSQSKQGKYLLMAYPFLALLMAAMLRARSQAARAPRGLGALLALGLGLPALALAAVAWSGAGGARLQAQVQPYLGPLRLDAALLALGALVLAARAWTGQGRSLARDTALPLGLVMLVSGTWGFRLLDPLKGYRAWTRTVQPLITGRQVFYWQTIRSGVMVYTDHLMPELRSRAELERMAPDARLVAMDREWNTDAWGMDARARNQFEVLLRMPVGGGQALLIRKRPAPATAPVPRDGASRSSS